jgi:hypothetical protein
MSADDDFQLASEPDTDEFSLPVPPAATAPWPAVLAACLICAAISASMLVVYWNARHPQPTYFASGLIGVLPFLYSKIAQDRRWEINSGRAIRTIIGLVTFVAFIIGFWMVLGSFGIAMHCDQGCF